MIERFSLSFYTRGASSAIFSLPHPFRLLLLMELKKSGSIWKKELGEPARMMDVVSEKAFATALGAPVDFVPHSPDQPNQQSHILICRQQQKENVVPSLPGVCRLYNVPSRGPIQWKATGRVLTALHVCIQQVRESHIHTIGTCTRFRHELPEAIRRRRTLSCLVKETFRERKKREWESS